MTQTPAGWFPQGDGRERYWDGAAWTDQFRPLQQEAPASYPPQQFAPQYAQPKKSHTLRNVLLILVGLMVLGVGGCLAVVGLAADSVNDSINDSKKDRVVTYKVAGTAKKADITWTTDGSTSTSQKQGASLPWEKEITIGGEIIPVYQVFAQNSGARGKVTCEILVDGKSVKTGEAQGAYAVASCDYTP